MKVLQIAKEDLVVHDGEISDYGNLHDPSPKP